MLEFLLFIVVIVLVIALVSRSGKQPDTLDYYSMSYRQGYWDGVRATEQKHGISPELASPEPAINPEPAALTYAVGDYDAAAEAAAADPSLNYVDVPLQMSPYGYVTTLDSPSPDAAYMGQPLAPTTITNDERRERNRSHTINIALYVASLLLVSGIILLAQTIGLSSVVKFAIVWLLIFVFYVAGFVINRHVPILKPAAVAFIGTALAAVPIAGITMYYLVTKDAAICWLVTSLIGSAMYIHATMAMKSQLLAYVSILSLFIFSCTLPAVSHAQVMWYYVVMIAFGSFLTLLAHYKYAWIPREFAEPIVKTSPVAVPVALTGAVFSFWTMTAGEYAAVFGVASLYYVAQAVIASTSTLRTTYWVIARCIIIIAAVSFVAALTDNSWVMMSYALAAAGLVNAVSSIAFLAPRLRTGESHHEIMQWIGFGVALLATGMVLDVTNPGNAFIMTVEYVAIILVAMYGLVHLRRFEFAIPLLLGLTVLPILVGKFVASPVIDTQHLFITYTLMLVAALGVRTMRPGHMGEAAVIYSYVGVWLMIMGVMAPLLGGLWGAAWWVILAAVCYFIVIRERVDIMIVFGNAAVLAALASLGRHYQWATNTTVVVLTAVNALMTIGGSEYARTQGERGADISKLLQIGGIIIGTTLALFALVTIDAENLKAAAWLALVGILYYVAWRSRSIVSLTFGHIATVIELWLIAVMLQFTWPETTAFVGWLAFIGFVGVSEWWRSSGRMWSAISATWQTGMLTAVTFGVLALFSGFSVAEHDAMWRTVAWLAAVVALYYATYRTGNRQLLYGANLAVVVLIGLVGVWASLTIVQTAVCVAWVGLGAFYVGGRVHRAWRHDTVVWDIMFLSAILTTTIAGVFALFSSSQTDVLAAGVALLAIGSAICYDDRQNRRLRLLDLGVIIGMIGFQRMIGVYFPDMHHLVYTHLWALAAFVVAYVYLAFRTRPEAKVRLIMGLLLLSLPTLNAALSEGGGPQLLFLIEHVLIVIAGLIYAYRVATWWGAAGVTLAVLYMLKGYTSLLTIAIGLIVIGAVVYVIVKSDKNRTPPPTIQS